LRVNGLDWVCEMLRIFEERYGMSSEEFYRKWVSGEIPEPIDQEKHGDFLVWEALVAALKESGLEPSACRARSDDTP